MAIEEIIKEKEFNKFVDKGFVTKKRMYSIAKKVINKKGLTVRESAIFMDKISDINTITRELRHKELSKQPKLKEQSK